MSRFPLLVAVALALAAIVIVVAVADGDDSWAVPIVVLVALCVGFALFHRVLAAGKRRKYGSAEEADRQGDDSVPHLAFDDKTELGDTPEAHSDLSPHDLPPDSEARKAVEERARTE